MNQKSRGEATDCGRDVQALPAQESNSSASRPKAHAHTASVHPLHMLWELRQYLARMRDLQTVLVRFDGMRGPECVAFEFTDGYSLGDDFKELGYPMRTSQAMADIGLDPLKYGKVYAYIERRAPAFVNAYYGWGVER